MELKRTKNQNKENETENSIFFFYGFNKRKATPEIQGAKALIPNDMELGRIALKFRLEERY